MTLSQLNASYIEGATLVHVGEEAAGKEKLTQAIQETRGVRYILQKDKIVCSAH